VAKRGVLTSGAVSSAPTRGAVLGLITLWLGVLLSAYGVVWTTHDSRKKIHSLESMRRQAADLQVEWGQYLLEQSAWAAYSRIERLALQDLDMIIPDSEKIVMVKE